MTAEQVKLLCDLYTNFVGRCEYICHTLLKDLNKYRFMTEFTLDVDSDKVECCGSDVSRYGIDGEYYEFFPVDLIYKSDEEILQWKNEILESQRKVEEELEKLKRQRELDCEYQRYLELKHKFEK
jgi:hypothetical protein